MICKSIYIIFSKFFQYNIYCDKTQMLKNFFGQNKRYKKCALFSFASSNSSALLLICDFNTSWSTRFISLKLCGTFHFWLRLLFRKGDLFFCSTKSMDCLTLNRRNSFQNKNNRKTADNFVPRPLIFKMQQKVWKFNDTCVSWCSPKTGLVKNFLNLENEVLRTSLFCQ